MLQRIRLWKLRSKKANALARAAAGAGTLSRPGRRCSCAKRPFPVPLIRIVASLYRHFVRQAPLNLHRPSRSLGRAPRSPHRCLVLQYSTESRGQQARLSNAQRHMPLCEQRSGLPIRPGTSRSAAASALALRSLAPVVPSEPESVVSRRGLTRSWPGSPRGRCRPGRGPCSQKNLNPTGPPAGRAVPAVVTRWRLGGSLRQGSGRAPPAGAWGGGGSGSPTEAGLIGDWERRARPGRRRGPGPRTQAGSASLDSPTRNLKRPL